MAGERNGDCDHINQPAQNYLGQLCGEPVFSAFVCPLTNEIMRDPVTIENGQTFEREAIENWFRDCRENGNRFICPVTQAELQSDELKPSISLRSAIQEWAQRNEASRLNKVYQVLGSGSSGHDVLHALDYIIHICHRSKSNNSAVMDAGLVTVTADMLRNSSRSVRCKALETLRILAEENDDRKEVMAAGDTVRTVIKFLRQEHSRERRLAIALLYELSKCRSLCEAIGGVGGAILILDGLASSSSGDIAVVEKAEKTLQNLEKCEVNVRQMAESGRMRPLLTLLLEGPPDTRLLMASYLEELVLSNDVKVFMAQTAGSPLISIMSSGSMQEREVALKALNQISSYEVSAKVLIESGILPPLVKGLFDVGTSHLPMKWKEISATILANLVASGATDIELIPLDDDGRTLVSDDVVHNLLQLISNTGPAIECNLLQVLDALTKSSRLAPKVVSAIKSSGAAMCLIQFIEAPQWDVRVPAIKLLRNISPYMAQELAETLQSSPGLFDALLRVMSENNYSFPEEQTAAIAVLANLPERSSALTGQLWKEGTFEVVISKMMRIRQGETLSNRYVTHLLEGLVRVLAKLTCFLLDEPEYIAFARKHNLAALFADLLQNSVIDNIQIVSATALENLSRESKALARVPEVPKPGKWSSMFVCFSKPPPAIEKCEVHGGICSMRDSFCIVEGKVVEKLVACLDHANAGLVEAALAALGTLLEDSVDIKQGVLVLLRGGGIKPILDILVQHRSAILRQRAVWAAERILRMEEAAYELSGEPSIVTALIEAFRHGDHRTKQIAEQALKHVHKLPSFSGVITKMK